MCVLCVRVVCAVCACCVYVRGNMFVCACLCACCVCVGDHICASVRVFLSVCVRAAFVWVTIYVCACVRVVFMWVAMYVRLCASLCLCVSVCVVDGVILILFIAKARRNEPSAVCSYVHGQSRRTFRVDGGNQDERSVLICLFSAFVVLKRALFLLLVLTFAHSPKPRLR